MPEQQMGEEQMKALQEKIKQMSPEELKEFQKKQCIFCQIISGKVQSKKVFEDESTIGILDINPANPGHILLLPKEHYSIMPQIPEDDIGHLFMTAKALSNAMLRALEVQGTNIIVANGVAAGQRAQHFMIHVIPRKENDGLKFEIPQKTNKLEDLEEIRKKLVENLGGKAKEEKESIEPVALPKKVVEAEFEEKTEEEKVPQKKKETIKESPISQKSKISGNLENSKNFQSKKKQIKKPTAKKEKKPKKEIEEKEETEKEPISEESANLDDIARVLGAK